MGHFGTFVSESINSIIMILQLLPWKLDVEEGTTGVKLDSTI